jgi:C4-dicarboxylate-specific signal transduction histidine kinase
MSGSTLVFIEEQLARRAELIERIGMIKNHLAGVSSLRRDLFQDVTAREFEKLQAEIAAIDEGVALMRAEIS